MLSVPHFCSIMARRKNHVPEPFGKWLKRRRQELDLTQRDIEKNGGPTQQYVSDLERSADTDNPLIPRPPMQVKLARGMGVPLAEVQQAAASASDGLAVQSLAPGAIRLTAGIEIVVDLRDGPYRGTLSEKTLRALVQLLDPPKTANGGA